MLFGSRIATRLNTRLTKALVGCLRYLVQPLCFCPLSVCHYALVEYSDLLVELLGFVMNVCAVQD